MAQYARVWYVDMEANSGSEDFEFPTGFPSDEEMLDWAGDIADRNDAQFQSWEEISKEEYQESTGL